MSGHFTSDFPESGSVDYSDQSTNLDETAIAELNELAGRYPQARSALLPMLHLVQSYDGRISPRASSCAPRSSGSPQHRSRGWPPSTPCSSAGPPGTITSGSAPRPCAR